MSNKNILENIKKLREITGVGFKDCKNALEESSGDIEKSVEFLRKKGIAKASKKMSRTASEGLVLVKEEKGEISLIEINSETDFVAKNNDFLDFAEILSRAIHENQNIKDQGSDQDLESLEINKKPLSGCLTDLISKIGENIQIVSYKKYASKESIFITYLHNKYNSNCSKIGSVVEIASDNIEIALNLVEELKVIAMQISAMKPMGIDENSINPKILDDEKDIILKQMNNVPEDKKDQIIKGKLNKFIKENTLLGQALITEPKKTVHSFLNEVSKNNNINLNIISMDLYTI